MTDPRPAIERFRDTLKGDDVRAYADACRDLWTAAREWKDDAIALHPGHLLHPDHDFDDTRPRLRTIGEAMREYHERYEEIEG